MRIGREMQTTGESTTGYSYFVGIGVTLWKCKRQPTIAVSTMQAEYMTTPHCTKEAVWLRQFLANMEYVQENSTPIMCDHRECIALAKNPTYHLGTKYIDVQHHFVGEKLEKQDICLKHCPRMI